MDTRTERYEGATREIDGYDESSGTIYTFSSSSRVYSFSVDDGSRYADSRGAVVDGRMVKVYVHEPYGANDAVIGIPRSCIAFQQALGELEKLGVNVVRFYDRVSGGFSSLSLSELSNPE
jgi:hypothetical protein